MTTPKKVYFENLDAIRFILAIMVLLGHSMFDVSLNQLWDNSYFHDFTHAISNGSQAVAFFFVLSGFLITYLLIKEKEEKSSVNIPKFYMRRILRIWPVYFFVVIFGYVLYPFLKSLVGWETTITSIWQLDSTFLANFSSIYVHAHQLVGQHPMMLNITWSVSIEEQFYLVWPLLFLAKKKYLPYIISILFFGSIFFISLHKGKGHILYYHTLSRVMDLSMGGFFALLAYYSKRFITFFTNLSKGSIITVYIIGVTYYIFGEHFPQFDIPFLYRFLLCLFYVFVICEQNYSNNSFTKFGRWKFGSNQGKYTYGLYMLHPIGIQVAIVSYQLLGIDNTSNFFYGMGYVIISLSFGYVIAYLSFHYFESYFLKLKSKF